MQIQNATWTEVRDTDTNLAMVPIGSTEQHGPHAALSTDTLNAETIAETAADQLDEPVVVSPAVPVSIAEEHRQFSGTLWTSESTFRSYVRDIVKSLAFHGFDRVVLVNGHGGNVAALREVAGTITRHDDAYAVPFTWFEEVGENASRMGHGGPLETALLQYANPDYVREDRLDDAATGGSRRWGDWVGRVNLAFDSAEFTENGVVGDPREASVGLGEDLLDVASEILADLLKTISEHDIERPPHK
ncbi:creatininase family protein [Halopelagius fulvigenes]|uniref:Creatininase family protein n=1 Tax=Halopelagius fulvigenes TaxID=1198324 RepID=A0ABD5TWC7_9EURY